MGEFAYDTLRVIRVWSLLSPSGRLIEVEVGLVNPHSMVIIDDPTIAP